jgi:hypothetical protein
MANRTFVRLSARTTHAILPLHSGHAMIVLCNHESCGAVLRVASTDTPVTAVLLADAGGRYFICPRCFRRTELPHTAARSSLDAERHVDAPTGQSPTPG